MVEVLYRHEHIIGKTSQKWKKKKKKKIKTHLYINEQFYIWEDYKNHRDMKLVITWQKKE